MNPYLACRRHPGWTALSALLGTGCSLFYQLNTTQCETNEDCQRLGITTPTTCVNRVCVSTSVGTGGAGGGGATGGSSGAGGAPPECTTNEYCISKHSNTPYICQDGACVGLLHEQCPFLLPKDGALEYLKAPAPIILGAYSTFTTSWESYSVWNWELGFNEFNDETRGLSGGPNNSLRPLVAVVCQADSSQADWDLSKSMDHLVNKVRVPAILSSLGPNDLFDAWTWNLTRPDTQPVFFMSPNSADVRLVNLKDSNLVWHMLGNPRQLAAPTQALMARTEAYLKSGAVGLTRPLTVTLIVSDYTSVSQVAAVLASSTEFPEEALFFNGEYAAPQDGTNFYQATIGSALTTSTLGVAPALTVLQAHPPDVIVAMATSEFVKDVIPQIEDNWDTWVSTTSPGQRRPFYILSHKLFNLPDVLTTAQRYSTETPPLHQRMVGVNYAQSTVSSDLYGEYLLRLKAANPDVIPVSQLENTENFYDAVYYLLYSVAAAVAVLPAPTGAVPSGAEIARALTDRVISQDPGAASVNIGPLRLGTTVGALASLQYKISLTATMGPPDFDRTTGTRNSPTSLWCVDPLGTGTPWQFEIDAALYDPTQPNNFLDSYTPFPCVGSLDF